MDELEFAGVRAGGFELAVEGDGLAGEELALQVGSAEPHGFDGVGALAYGDFKEGAGGGVEESGAADFADDGGHGVGLQVGDGLDVEAVFVAEGEVIQEVFNSVDLSFGEVGGDVRADSLDELHGG